MRSEQQPQPPEPPQLLAARQLVERYPAIKLRTLRYWIQHAAPRHVTNGGQRRILPGNGLADTILRKGRIILIDEARFLDWLYGGRGHG